MIKRTVSRCNCFAIRQAARRITRLYEHHLGKVGLTNAQFSILATLNESEGMTMTELADTLEMDRTTLLRALQPLERQEWVASSAGANSRQFRLSLTPAGVKQRKRADKHWQAAQDEFEHRVSTQRAASMREELLALSF